MKKNEVIVLGTIHSGHFEHKEYSLGVLKSLILSIDPDYILVEIPPDRLPKALSEWKNNKYILDSRVRQFPEYSDVIIPMLDTGKFELVPVSAWTEQMSIKREATLDKIYKDLSRKDDIIAYQNAVQAANKILSSVEDEYDPLWINSDGYDEAIDIQMSAFERSFGADLDKGGWERINQSHYHYIEKALDKYSGAGKRILITFGAGHRGWFRRALQKRIDIELKELIEVI